MWPEGFLHRFSATFHGLVVMNMTTGERLVTFPFSLQDQTAMAGIRAYAFMDKVRGRPASPYFAREIAESDRLHAIRCQPTPKHEET